jgi:type III restriction enzyme
MILLEMKGAELDIDHAKYQAAQRWVSAVNNWGRLGRWAFMVCRDPLALPGLLTKHGAMAGSDGLAGS